MLPHQAAHVRTRSYRLRESHNPLQVFCVWNLSKHKVSTALQWVPAELASLKKVEFMPLHEVRPPPPADHAHLIVSLRTCACPAGERRSRHNRVEGQRDLHNSPVATMHSLTP